MIQEPILTTSLSIASNDVEEYREKVTRNSKKIARQLIPQKKPEKQEQLANDVRGLLVLLTGEELDAFDDLWTNDRLFNHEKFEKKSGCLLDLWPPAFKEIAKLAINTTPTALGTPNAASGKGEFFLRLSSRQFKGITKGDVEYDNGKTKTKFELKKGGKIGSKAPYKTVNEKLIIFCKTHGLSLPKAKIGKNAMGNQQFIPKTIEATAFLGSLTENLQKAFLKELWNELKFSSNLPELDKYSWENFEQEFVKAAVSDHFKENGDSFLVIHDDYCYNIFDNTDDFINFYKTKKIEFEARAYADNGLAFYVR